MPSSQDSLQQLLCTSYFPSQLGGTSSQLIVAFKVSLFPRCWVTSTEHHFSYYVMHRY